MNRLRATKGKRKQRRRPPGRPRLRFGPPDASLTSCSGLAAVTAPTDRLRFVETLDRCVGEVKQRRRGLGKR